VNPDVITPELKTVLRRLKLSRMLDTLSERFALARQQKMPHQDFLLLALSDEATRRGERWDETSKVEFDRSLLTSNAYDLIIEGESYRDRLKPGRKAGQRTEKKAK
jgi:hypothetical protein